MAVRTQLDVGQRARLRSRLLAWYRRERRDLPWRKTRDPYRIWVSEIMLQQTRVAAVLEKYGSFLERFPDVQSLARAELSEVLTLWSGLGYYRRARALHEAARKIVAGGGVMPRTAEQWRELPGIGRYTAAAIASIAHGERCAVVDGNVERVVHRVMGQRGPVSKVWAIAESWLSPRHPGDFNQAMMELGATVCLPASPHCERCPLHPFCRTRGTLPVEGKAQRNKKESAYALMLKNGGVYLKQRRAEQSLMPGMWELPEAVPNGDAPLFAVQHAITTTDFRVSVYRSHKACRGGRWVKITQLLALPLTGLTRKILRRAEII